jgi:hypothetical protein
MKAGDKLALEFEATDDGPDDETFEAFIEACIKEKATVRVTVDVLSVPSERAFSGVDDSTLLARYADGLDERPSELRAEILLRMGTPA